MFTITIFYISSFLNCHAYLNSKKDIIEKQFKVENKKGKLEKIVIIIIIKKLV